MIQALVTDFSRVLLFPVKQDYDGGLNVLNNKLLADNPDYDFWRYFRLNNELLAYYKSLDLPTYVFSSETIQDHPAVKPLLAETFKAVLSAKGLGVKKATPEAYRLVAKKLGIDPGKLLYIDDKPEHIAAAGQAGCVAVLYRSNKQAIDALSQAMDL